MAKYQSYVICTSPRSGSTLLCQMLTATGVAGRPASYFFGTSLKGWLDDLGLQSHEQTSERDMLEAAFRTALIKGRNGSDMFGLRLQGHSLAFFLEKLAALHSDTAADFERFQLAFGTTLFVHLTRPNKVEQAISLLKAQQSGLWHVASDGSELERTAPHREPVYDGMRLKAIIEEMTTHDQNWNRWFAREAIEPVRLSYDDLSADPLSVLRHVLDRLGLDADAANGVTTGVRKLAGAMNNDWALRFEAEHGPAAQGR